MIDLTVRTLDSQNHPFSVEDDITVAQFKTKIADTVNIPAETQRIIYCGRVLEDDVKLSDYDVNGKVVHLVERAPPSLQGNSETGAPAPQPQRRRFRGFEQGNAMYLGTMAIPLESQGIVPPPPTHSLAASRLNVARRMLKRAEAVIRSLEDPHFRPTEQSTTVEEPQEEVTPVFEARVIVPHTDEPIDEDLVLSAVENSLVNVGAVPVNSETVFVPTEASVEANSAEQPQSEAVASPSTLPVENSPQSTTTAESSSSDRRNPSDGSNSNLSENASRTSEMSELLTMLGELQVRFAPFLERYQNFMREDPVVADEELRQTQTMINRVSEVLHFLGHAYHSLSDIILKVRTPPPRALLCRPILIQHSAVVQTGFPIQLEAQINFTRPTTTSEGQASTTTSSTTVTSTSNTSTSTTPTQPPVTANIQPPLVGVPLIPGASMRFQSIPVEIRGISRNIRSTNNNNVPSTRGSQQTAGDATAGVEDGVSSDTASTATNQQAGDAAHNNSRANNQTPGFNIPGLDNRNVEFFMEVTPGNIMSGFGGSNPASDVLRGSLPLNPLPPELIQSIMEMAGQMINLDPQQLNINVSRSTEPSAPPSESGSTAQSGVNRGVSGQNSQARGNTETNPTTATHTRSTSRPHVHLAQHAMQGFDPFLPCNSHHVSSRRRIHIRNVNQQVGQGASNRNRTQRETAQQTNTSGNLGPELLLNVFQNYFRNVSNQASGGSSEQSGATRPDSATPASWPSFASFLPHLQNMNLSDGGRQGPTIAQILQQFPSEEAYQERQSVFSDLVMFLSRNLTIGDVIQLTSRRLEPLLRIRNELRNFVLQRILDGSTSAAAVDRGVNRLINEIQPFLENLGLLQVRNDIDVIRSAEMLFRARLPNIINLSTSRSPNALRLLVNQCTITARQLCALVVTASATGETGVQEVFERIVTNYMVGIPADIQQWTLITSRVQFQRFISNLSVPESVLQPYIVRRAEAVLPSIVNSVSSNDSTGSSDEPMECDVSSAAGGSTEFNTSINLTDENEPLPAVVIGSEGWHSQVPADWVPIITRDTQRQRRQNSQPPFSDAYLSGMPSKRRKIVTSSKPQGSLPQVISESVRRAVTASGLASVAPLETVAQATGGDVNVQAAYRDLLRSSVQTVIQDNEDFTPDRFPNASNYFNRQ